MKRKTNRSSSRLNSDRLYDRDGVASIGSEILTAFLFVAHNRVLTNREATHISSTNSIASRQAVGNRASSQNQ